MLLTPEHTSRGFVRFTFRDVDQTPCSLQESSLASDDCIWLGTDRPGDDAPDRMHLTRDMASTISVALRRFVEDGDVPSEDLRDRYGSACSWRIDRESMLVGVERDFNGRDARRMRLGRDLAAELAPILGAFAANGRLDASGRDAGTPIEVLPPPPSTHLNRSQMEAVAAEGTSITFAALADIVEKIDGVLSGERETLGWDLSARIERIAQELRRTRIAEPHR